MEGYPWDVFGEIILDVAYRVIPTGKDSIISDI
jgi:hypothetical protein